MARMLIIERYLERRRIENLVLRRRELREGAYGMDLPNTEFQSYFRLSKVAFVNLCEELRPFMSEMAYCTKISQELRILAALSFFACGSYQKGIGANFTLGMSQTSISRAIHEVITALNHRDILARHVHFPDREERSRIKEGFMEKFGMPGVIGCIDGSHVAMIRPTEHEEMFFNRKNYHSRNVQVICDDDLNIMHVDASFGGASHDSYIWNNSVIKRYLEQLTEDGEAVWLLGDLGYAQRPFLMTPILNAAEGSPEGFYNKVHAKARNTVERCIGVLKSRWRCLLVHRVLHYDHLTVALIVNAVCVLHNIANRNRLPVPVLPDIERIQEEERQPDRVILAEPGGEFVQVNREAARPRLVQMMWENRRR